MFWKPDDASHRVVFQQTISVLMDNNYQSLQKSRFSHTYTIVQSQIMSRVAVNLYRDIKQLYFLNFSMGILSSIFHTNSYITLGLPVNATNSSDVLTKFAALTQQRWLLEGKFRDFNFSVDLHGSKPLISLVPITCTVYCYQG